MYKDLFAEIQIKNIIIKNRIIFCGGESGFAKKGQPTTKFEEYYLERARGGVGLIELEPNLLFNKCNISNWREFIRRIKTYNTKIVATFDLQNFVLNSKESSFEKSILELTDLLHNVGIDGISFIFKNEKQLNCFIREELLIRIGHKHNEDFLIGLHLPASGIKDNKLLENFLKESVVDYLAIPSYEESFKLDVPITIVKSVSFAEPESCDKLLRDCDVDLLELNKQLKCDPHWPLKAELGKENEIRKCYCDKEERCVIPTGQITCVFNPYLGFEYKYSENNMIPAAKIKNIVVVGSSVAGMQVAITASKRGHVVFLLEEDDELGNNLKVTNGMEIVTWYVEELKRNQVDVRIGLPVTSQHIAVLKPDIVIIDGLDSPNIKSIASSFCEKGVQVIFMNYTRCDLGDAIMSGFNIAIGI